MTVQEAAEKLGVAPEASDDLKKEAFRERARACHPDLATSESDRITRDEDLRQLLEARDLLLGYSPAPATPHVEVFQPVPPEMADDDFAEVVSLIVSLVLATVLYAVAMWLLTTHFYPRGFSARTTWSTLFALLILWAFLYMIISRAVSELIIQRKA